MKVKILEEIPVTATHFHQCNATIHHLMDCYNVMGEPDDDELLDINIPDLDGMRIVEGFVIFSNQFLIPLKVKRVNIALLENTKFPNIGDYWDDETMGKIIDLLHEFQHMFPTKFLEMKGIFCNLHKMKIPLRPDAKPVK